ncbi:MAG: nitroreductase family protein [Acidimicrobiaceae bacterium]|nr:nitroreductase family protein [Acidimicrobiaceae bacterium]
MEFEDLWRRRRMYRSFTGDPLDLTRVSELVAESLRAPTAGNCAGVRATVVGPERLGEFLLAATDEEWRMHSRRLEGLSRAGAVVIFSSLPEVYAARYRESDKADSGLGDVAAWPVPYWHTDAAMATLGCALLCENEGWGVALWGAFRHAEALHRFAHLENEEIFATLFVGIPDHRDPPSSSLARTVPTRAQRVRRLD